MSILTYRQTIMEILKDGEPWSKLDLELECERIANELAIGYDGRIFERDFDEMLITKDIVKLPDRIPPYPRELYRGKCIL